MNANDKQDKVTRQTIEDILVSDTISIERKVEMLAKISFQLIEGRDQLVPIINTMLSTINNMSNDVDLLQHQFS